MPKAAAGVTRGRSKEVNVEDVPRHSFTPGWEHSISQKEALPVKRNGKVFRMTRPDTQRERVEEEEEEEPAPTRKKSLPDSKKRKKPGGEAVEGEGGEGGEGGGEKEHVKKDKAPKAPVVMTLTVKTPQQVQQLQRRIAEICSSIVTSPEKSLKKKLASDEDEGEKLRMVDLFELLGSADAQEFELAMLSALIVFKDIVPSYRIRSAAEYDKEVQLKKDTKNLKDFELSLLGAYQRFLKVLEGKVSLLGNPRNPVAWGLGTKLGLSALRCQCELIRALPHFNFRGLLLGSVAVRASQPDAAVSELCCATLSRLLQDDYQGELSFETVTHISKALAACKYNTNAGLIECLSSAKLTVHADESKNVHRQAKNARKKRKNKSDEVELGMLESSAVADASNKKRFQADCLHEVCLVYFRVMKQKVGFALLPAALQGLGRITHLINIDTVQDLMTLMKSLLEQQPVVPPLVQLRCVHCALRTLSGPGSELNLDGDIYLNKLRCVVRDMPASLDLWGVVIECMDICFLKKREDRTNVVLSFTRLLLMSAVHLSAHASMTAAAVYAAAHAILSRYPRVRGQLLVLKPQVVLKNGLPSIGTGPGKRALFVEDDLCEDLAMRALRKEAAGDATSGSVSMDYVDWDHREDRLGDGSWLLPLQRLHPDPRFRSITAALSSRDLLPLPMRAGDAQVDGAEEIMRRLTYSMQVLPHSLPKKGGGGGGGGEGGGGGGKKESSKRGFHKGGGGKKGNGKKE